MSQLVVKRAVILLAALGSVPAAAHNQNSGPIYYPLRKATLNAQSQENGPGSYPGIFYTNQQSTPVFFGASYHLSVVLDSDSTVGQTFGCYGRHFMNNSTLVDEVSDYPKLTPPFTMSWYSPSWNTSETVTVGLGSHLSRARAFILDPTPQDPNNPIPPTPESGPYICQIVDEHSFSVQYRNYP